MSKKSVIEYESLARSNGAYMAELEAAATRVIRSGWYVLGQEVSAFEAEFAEYVGAKHCIGVANGLDALILSIEALDLPKGSDILVASNTYIATILAIVRAGHRPVLVEPELETFNLDPSCLPQAMTAVVRSASFRPAVIFSMASFWWGRGAQRVTGSTFLSVSQA